MSKLALQKINKKFVIMPKKQFDMNFIGYTAMVTT